MFWFWYYIQSAVEFGFPSFEGISAGIYAGKQQYAHDKARRNLEKWLALPWDTILKGTNPKG